MSGPAVWQPLRDVIAEVIYMDPIDFRPDGEGGYLENWPNRLDFPTWNELSEEHREKWRREADRVLAVLASPIGCTPRMEQAARDMGAVDWLAATPADVIAEMFRAEIAAASNPPEIPGGSWQCPIGLADCTQNCGSYGCGN